MLGYTSRDDAKSAYAKHFPPDFKVGKITEMSVGRLRNWLQDGDLKKPLNRLRRV